MDIATEGPVERKTCIVVDEQDQTQYIGGLAECHVRPMTLHRAFSLFVFDSEGRLLLQQRAKTKYTFPLAWTNTVCSHPRNLDKTMEEWIDIRVQDELGWAIKDIQNRLRPVGKLTYSAISDPKYGEKEVDTLYFVQISEEEKADMQFNRDEVEAIDWVEPERLDQMLNDDRFLITPWFRAIANGFGFPFYERIQDFDASALPDQDESQPSSKAISEELPQDTVTSSSVTGVVSVTKFVEPKTGQTLPWFRVGNCSMPRANKESDLLLQAPFSFLNCNPGKAFRVELAKVYAEVDKAVSAKDVDAISWVVERIHHASILHDDIEDSSTTRRGAVCAHLIWGTAQTINTGTFNFLRAVQGIDEQFAHHDEAVRSKLMRCVLDTLVDLHRGQNAEIMWREQAISPSVAEYVEMADHKSGALMKACATLGSICSGNNNLGEQLGELFQEVGRFFQLRDDLCNLCDPVYWKARAFFDDADEGKFTLPILMYLDKKLDVVDPRGETDERKEDHETHEWVRARLSKRSEPLSLEEKLKLYQLLYESNTLHEAREQCVAKAEALRNSVFFKSPRAHRILDILYIPEIPTPDQVKTSQN